MMAHDRFDVIVVGGGSAGCVVANRLTEDGSRSVCLIEAGPDYGPQSEGHWPPELLDVRKQPETHDWGLSASQPGGGTRSEPRAKVVGGCSSHNQCAAIWGLPSDYDGWANAGNPGWTYAELRPLIDRIESVAPGSESAFRGRGGALPTRRYSSDELTSWQSVFLEGALSQGFVALDDLSAPADGPGVAPMHANAKGTVRWNAAFAFLDPARHRPGLTIRAETRVDRLLIEVGRFVGVSCSSDQGRFELRAARVVLCAGTYGSPAILMRSGIGPAARLADIGIPVVRDLPGVGENLHDHPGVALSYQPTRAASAAATAEAAKGTLYSSQVVLRAASARCGDDFDLHVLPFQSNTAGELGFHLVAFDMAPLSRGRVTLSSADPEGAPIIDFKFFSDSAGRDLDVLVQVAKLVRALAGTNVVRESVEAETDPGSGVTSVQQLGDYIIQNATSYSHAVGTCRMGPEDDAFAVVDADGRLHGFANVYVADASIMPTVPRANTNLSTMLIGLRVADQLAIS